jgi:hypothetical protein
MFVLVEQLDGPRSGKIIGLFAAPADIEAYATFYRTHYQQRCIKAFWGGADMRQFDDPICTVVAPDLHETFEQLMHPAVERLRRLELDAEGNLIRDCIVERPCAPVLPNPPRPSNDTYEPPVFDEKQEQMFAIVSSTADQLVVHNACATEDEAMKLKNTLQAQTWQTLSILPTDTPFTLPLEAEATVRLPDDIHTALSETVGGLLAMYTEACTQVEQKISASA